MDAEKEFSKELLKFLMKCGGKLSVSKVVQKSGLQPRNGFLPIGKAEKIIFQWSEEDKKLFRNLPEYSEYIRDLLENYGEPIPSSTIGLVVDYLTRAIIMSKKARSRDARMEAVIDAFSISLKGARLVSEEDFKKASELCLKITKAIFEENYSWAIINSCRLVQYDTKLRAGFFDEKWSKIKPSGESIGAIEEMLERTIEYLEDEDELMFGVCFSGEGTKYIASSDCDIITKDSLIDLKCSKNKPTIKQTLQLLLYYILGMHEQKEIFSKIKYLKLVNPLQGTVHSFAIGDIDQETLQIVEKEVMGYTKSAFGN